MIKIAFLVAFAATSVASAQQPSPDLTRLRAEAARVTITRDDWGIAHVRGHTDADAVFGMIYAQAEDDFNRVETNYLLSIGRLAEADGEKEIYRDLRQRLFIDPDSMRAMYARSPASLKSLMDAWADGLNYYLATHPGVKPRAITHFEPWMPLTFSEGSIGGDIERVSLAQLAEFYGKAPSVAVADDPDVYREPTGSNGFAIAPSNTASHHALLWINPHTSFFFRSELQMQSDEGLDAYGAVTWGQFFVYQGFNPRVGWMHTSSGVDAIDEYLETVTQKDGRYYYKLGNEERPMLATKITIPYKTAGGAATKEFTVYHTIHGPVIRAAGEKWVSIALMNKPIEALTESYVRTKARNLADFRKMLDLHANSSNNTVYADADGNIAYFQANFIPERDTHFDWTKPVDGSNPATLWHASLPVERIPHLINPRSGWLFNTNDSPWSAAGLNSLNKSDFPAYVESGTENPRGIHALRVLSGRHDFTPKTVVASAFDSWLPSFDDLIPSLLTAYDGTPNGDPLKTRVADQVATLRGWDHRWSVSSVPTTLAVYWGEDLWRRTRRDADDEGVSVYEYMAKKSTPRERLQSLADASAKLVADFGTWKKPWGEINRFQRLTGDIVQPFNDAAPSIPVGFTSSQWGSLASFGATTHDGTKKRYGTSGNSFLAIVEFGDSVRARAVSAGGESGDPKSKHFNDQAQRYADGNLREVYFYPSQLVGHTERKYHPGD